MFVLGQMFISRSIAFGNFDTYGCELSCVLSESKDARLGEQQSAVCCSLLPMPRVAARKILSHALFKEYRSPMID